MGMCFSTSYKYEKIEQDEEKQALRKKNEKQALRKNNEKSRNVDIENSTKRLLKEYYIVFA